MSLLDSLSAAAIRPGSIYRKGAEMGGIAVGKTP